MRRTRLIMMTIFIALFVLIVVLSYIKPAS